MDMRTLLIKFFFQNGFVKKAYTFHQNENFLKPLGII